MRKLTLFLVLCLGILAPALALGADQPASIEQINQQLDRDRATLDETHKALDDPELTNGALRLLRDRVEPLRRELEETIDQLTPRLAAVDARLKELAPAQKAAEPPPPPPPTVAQPKPAKPAPAKPEAKAPIARSGAPEAQKAEPVKSDGKKPDAAKPDAGKAEAGKAGVAPPSAATEQGSAEASVSAELVEQRRVFDAIDATLKRARALLLEVKQTSVTIVARQRGLFARTLFLRTDGLFSPGLWRAAMADLPSVVDSAHVFLSDRATNFSSRLADRRAEFFMSILAILLIAAPALIYSRRVLARNGSGKEPIRLLRAAAAGWTALVAAAVPVAVVTALGYALESYNLLDSGFEPIWRRIFEAVTRISVVYGVARAVFAPAHPEWRLIDAGDALSRLLVRLLTIAAIVMSITRLFEQIEEFVQASVPVVIVTRGVGVVMVALLLAIALYASSWRVIAAQDAAPATREGRDWVVLARLLGALSFVLIVGACAAGYVTFAHFVILQIGWLAAVAAMLYVVVILASGGVEQLFSEDGLVGRGLVNGLGVPRHQLAPIGVLLSGGVTLLAYLVAALVALAPWGYESNDFFGKLRASFFSFTIGDVTISPSSALTSVAIFVIALTAAQGFRRWLDKRFMPLTRLDMGLRNSISSTLGYAGFLLAAGLALSHIGLGFEKLAIVAGALSVGIGFGLQSIVNNFVSGLILLWERVIRVGDWVVIGDEQGYVRRINVRSTEIETFDRATMIVPNSNLVTGVVKNWLRGDRVGRIKIALSPHAGVDPEKMREIMLAAARAQEGVVRIPAPQVMFLGMEATSFKFELWCYVEDVETSSRVRSDLHFDLHRRLTEAGIKMAAPPTPTSTILQIPDLEKLAAATAVGALALDAGAEAVGLATEKAAETAPPQEEKAE